MKRFRRAASVYLLLSAAALAQNPHELWVIPDVSATPATGSIRFVESAGWLAGTGGNYVGFRAPASITANVLWTLPAADGSADQVLCTDGAGVLGFCTSGAVGLPVSDNTSIVKGDVDGSKQIRFEVDGLTASIVRVLTIQDADHTLAGLELDNEFTVKNIFSRDGGALLLGRNTEVLNFTSSIVTVVSNGTKLAVRMVGGGPALAMWKDEAAGGGGPTIAAAIGLSIPGVAAGNDLVLSTFATGGSWNERFTIENDGDIVIAVGHHFMANNTKLFMKDTLGANISVFWLDGSNFLNIGTINAINGTGDVIFWRDAVPGAKLAWSTADGEAYFGPAFDRLSNLGATDALWDEIKGEDVILGRNTIGTEVQGSIGLHTGHPLFDPALTITGNTIGLVAIDMFESSAGWFPTTEGLSLGFDDGITSRRWQAKLTNLDISGTCTGCSSLPVADTTSIVEGSADATKEIRFEVDGLTTGTVRVLTPPNADITIAGLNITQTWTATQTFDGGDLRINNPNLLLFINGGLISHKFAYGGANLTRVLDSSGGVVFEWNSAASPDLMVNYGHSIPAVTNTYDLGTFANRWRKGWLVDLNISGTCTGCGGAGGLPVVDTTSIVEGSADATKEIRFEVDGLTPGSVRVLTPPNADITLAGINLAQTWTATQTMQDIIPRSHNFYTLGNAATYWDEVSAIDVRVGYPSSTSALQGRIIIANSDLALEVAIISGGIKNTGPQWHPTVQIDHLVVTSSFYINQDAGDLPCTNVANGRFVQATASNELQICEGFSSFLTPYIASSFSPLTLNCAAGEVVVDPRYENGILVEGGCAPNL